MVIFHSSTEKISGILVCLPYLLQTNRQAYLFIWSKLYKNSFVIHKLLDCDIYGLLLK